MLCALYRTFLGWLDLNVVRFCFGSQRLLCAWYWTFHTCLAHHHKNTPSAWRGGILRTCALRFMFANKLRYSQLFASTFFCKRTFRARVWSSFPSIEVSLLFQNHFVIPVMTSSNNFRLDMIQRFKLPPWLWAAFWDHTAWRRVQFEFSEAIVFQSKLLSGRPWPRQFATGGHLAVNGTKPNTSQYKWTGVRKVGQKYFGMPRLWCNWITRRKPSARFWMDWSWLKLQPAELDEQRSRTTQKRTSCYHAKYHTKPDRMCSFDSTYETQNNVNSVLLKAPCWSSYALLSDAALPTHCRHLTIAAPNCYEATNGNESATCSSNGKAGPYTETQGWFNQHLH